jgi:hypothetical protein
VVFRPAWKEYFFYVPFPSFFGKGVKTLTSLHGSPRDERRILPPDTRIALPGPGGEFTVMDLEEDDFGLFSRRVTEIVITALRDLGIDFPSSPVSELVDNLIHAVPCSASIVVDPRGPGVTICDTGKGIPRVDLALKAGFSTADSLQRSFIRGVGLGLHLAKRDIEASGGELLLESIPGCGTFARVSLTPSVSPPELSHRQNNILFLLSEGEALGPSHVASELGITVSTAYRDLVKLQEAGLVVSSPSGKRFLSERGKLYLQGLLSL